MSWSLGARGSIDRLVRHFGEGHQITLRRIHSLKDPQTGKAVATLDVKGTVAIGGSTIDLDKTYLEGELKSGIQFTVAGDATVYETTNAIRASLNVLTGVTFTPVLVAEATDNAVVTISNPFKDFVFPCTVGRFRLMDLNDQIQSADRKITASVLGATVEWDDDDEALLDGKLLQVKDVWPLEPGTTRSGVVFHVAGD